jgi:protein TonB
MRSAYHSSSIETRGMARRRSAAFVLTVIAHILIILLLLRLAPSPFAKPEVQRDPVTFQMMPDQTTPTPEKRTPSPAKQKRASGGSPPRAAPRAAAAQAPPAPPKSPPPLPIKMIGGMEMFEAADISKMPSHPEDQLAGGDGGSGSGKGKDSGSAYGPGEGPGGQRLYNAEWYREPSHAELNGYLPNGAPPGGWALIACKTIPNYQVENCRSLGESPVGSGLARAMRQAAYQFRIKPPRIGGKPMVGEWVRIRIDFTDTPPKK